MIVLMMITKYFMFLAAIMNAVKLAKCRTRILKSDTGIEINGFTIRFILMRIMPFVCIGIFQLMGNHNNPFFVFSDSNSLYTLASQGVFLLHIIANILWINFWNGYKEYAFERGKSLDVVESRDKLRENAILIFGAVIFIYVLRKHNLAGFEEEINRFFMI